MAQIPNSNSKSFRALNPHIYGESTERVIDASAVDDESQLHNDIIAYCKNQRPPWIYFHGSMAYKTRRTIAEADFTVLASHGRTFYIEVKSKAGKLSPDQRDLFYWAATLGHKIHLVRSMDEFRKIVE